MSDETREEIEGYRERQMDRRKRERDERLGLVDVDEEDVKPSKKKKEEKVEEDKKKPMKYPAEGMFVLFFLCYCFLVIPKHCHIYRTTNQVVTVLTIDLLVEFAERDEKEGRILVRPALGTNLPFGDGFEKLILAWSFLNVMGYVFFFSSFASLLHHDSY